MNSIQSIFELGKVIPVLSYQTVEEAVKTSTALYTAGIRVFEITLRHETALDQIASVKSTLPAEAVIGAGTVMTLKNAEAAQQAGADFGVSPGLTLELADYLEQRNWPFLPGVATVSEAMAAQAHGFSAVKFFPAEPSGGTDFLKAAGSVLPGLLFCPTGGITAKNAADYLALGNVPVIGGSWLIERDHKNKIILEKISESVRLAQAL